MCVISLQRTLGGVKRGQLVGCRRPIEHIRSITADNSISIGGRPCCDHPLSGGHHLRRRRVIEAGGGWRSQAWQQSIHLHCKITASTPPRLSLPVAIQWSSHLVRRRSHRGQRPGWSTSTSCSRRALPPSVAGLWISQQRATNPRRTCSHYLASLITTVQTETRTSPGICALSPRNEISWQLTSLMRITAIFTALHLVQCFCIFPVHNII